MEPLTEKKLKHLEFMANRLRQDVIEMVSRAGSGPYRRALDMADIFAAMYFHILKHDPKHPDWPDRDRLVLSNGHFARCNTRPWRMRAISPSRSSRRCGSIGTRLQGHPHRGTIPGIETTSGPLGSGISQSIGMALAAQLDGKKWRTYCLTSDGEHEEGNTWEAVMFAGKNQLANLTVMVDRNNIQIDGFTEDIMPLESFARNMNLSIGMCSRSTAIISRRSWRPLRSAAIHEMPTVIIAHTIPGKGVDFMENDYLWHSKPFKPGRSENTRSTSSGHCAGK